MNNTMITFGGIIIIVTIVIVFSISALSSAEPHYAKGNRTESGIDLEETGYKMRIQSNEINLHDFPDDFAKSYLCRGNAKCISGFVTRIIDGDTVVVDNKSIRFSLVNTPEWGDKNYFQAGDYIETVCPVGSMVLVDEDDGQTQRSFGRIIGKVFCNGIILNEEILESGHAVILNKFCPVSEFANEPWAQKFGC